MMSSETWSKLLLLNAALVLFVSTVYTMGLVRRIGEAQAASSSPYPTLAAELKPFVAQGILAVGLSVVGIVASFVKQKWMVKAVFVLIVSVEACATYVNHAAMTRGFAKCHVLYGPTSVTVFHAAIVHICGRVGALLFGAEQVTVPGDAIAEARCIDAVHTVFATSVIVILSAMSLMMCAACKTHEAIAAETLAESECVPCDDDEEDELLASSKLNRQQPGSPSAISAFFAAPLTHRDDDEEGLQKVVPVIPLLRQGNIR
jgi:hypothetical protein